MIVLDSFGIGALPDADDFDDVGANTLRSVAAEKIFSANNMTRLGLFDIDGENKRSGGEKPRGAFARLAEMSCGKDTTVGHWEIAGLVSEKPLPTYPDGFPDDVTKKLEDVFGRKILCNKPYSGTKVIHDFGREHEETGALIVYTSADSVLQIAAHESIVPVAELYGYCEKARVAMQGEHGVGRIIARPFTGKFPHYERTSRRHDFSLAPTGATVLDALEKGGFDVIGVGKIADIFANRGLTKSLGVNEDNADGMKKTSALADEDFTGLAFVNLVDFDMKYGHRRDAEGYAKAIAEFDEWLGEFLPRMKDDDALMITADHGCDPKYGGTDHTREYVPFLMCGKRIRQNANLGTLPTFAAIGATIADIFGVTFPTKGESFWEKLNRDT